MRPTFSFFSKSFQLPTVNYYLFSRWLFIAILLNVAFTSNARIYANIHTTVANNGATAMNILGTVHSQSSTYDLKAYKEGKQQLFTTISKNIQQISCNGANDGSITIIPNDGISPYAYQWSIGATTASISGLSAGSYIVTITDAMGTSIIDTTTIVEPVPIALSYNSIPTSGYAVHDGTVNGLVTGGTPPYFTVYIVDFLQDTGSTVLVIDGVQFPYSWSSANKADTLSLAQHTVAGHHTFSGLPAGDYIVQVIDANGCLGAVSLEVAAPPNIISAAGDCDSFIDLTWNTIPNIVATIIERSEDGGMTWITLDSTLNVVDTIFKDVNAIQLNTAFNYRIKGKYADGTYTPYSNKFSVPAFSSVNVVASQTSCASQAAFQLPDGSPVDGIWSGVGVSNGNVFDPSVAGVGSHALIYTYSNGICSGADTMTMTVLATASVDAGINEAVCQTDAAFQLAGFSPNGGIWSGTGVTNNGIFDPSSAGVGSHTLTYTYISASCTVSDTKVVTVSTMPTVTAGHTQYICLTAATSISITGGSPSGGMWSGTGVNSSNGTLNPNVAGLGTHTLTYTYDNGCTNTASKDVSVVIPPSTTYINLTTCDPSISTGSITRNFTSYQGCDSTVVTTTTYIGSSVRNTTIYTCDPNEVGVETYTYINQYGCDSLVTITTVLQTPTTITTVIPLCQAPTTTLTAVATGTYFWTTGATANNITVSQEGLYAVTVTDIEGCQAIERFKVEAADTIATQTIDICQGESTALTMATGSSYLWSTGATTSSIVVSMAGNYEVLMTDGDNCQHFKVFQVNAHIPFVTATTSASNYCLGADIELDASGGVSYDWTGPNNFTSNSKSPLISNSIADDFGDYVVKVTDGYGCVDSATVTASTNHNTIPILDYSGATDLTNSIVTPTQGESSTFFHFEVLYTDVDGDLPANGQPKLWMDAENNSNYARGFTMQEADPTDTDVTDGKVYIYDVSGLPNSSSWNTITKVRDANGCIAEFGGFDTPDVLDAANIAIFANNIVFSDATPDTSEVITISTTIQNPSNFDVSNFDVRLLNQNNNTYQDTTVALVPASSTITLQWQWTTSDTPSYNPMQVILDVNDEVDEANEDDNTAVRAFTAGNFIIVDTAVGIVSTAMATPIISYPSGYITVSGDAHYRGLSQADSSVKGGAVTVFVYDATGTQVLGPLSTYTNNNGYFSKNFPKTSLTASATYNVVGVVTDFTLQDTFYTSFAIIDETSISDNITDIVIASHQVSSVRNCTSSNFSFLLKNEGDIPTGTFTTHLSIHKNGVLDTMIQRNVNNIGGNSGIWLSYNYWFDDASASYTIRLVADSLEVVTEDSETNNERSFNVMATDCKPDLEVLTCTYGDNRLEVLPSEPSTTGNIHLKTAIRNKGNYPVSNFDVTFLVVNHTLLDTAVYTVNYGGTLGVGQRDTVSVYNIPNPGAGNHDLIVLIDATNVINESAEYNNQQTGKLCYDFYLADVCYRTDFWQTTHAMFSPVSMAISVRNGGLYESGTVDVRFEVSGPGITGWELIGTGTISGQSTICSSCANVFTLPTTYSFQQAGVYQVRMMVDANDAYAECDETNNVRIVNVHIDAKPDMRVASEFINPSLLNPDLNEDITFDVTYENSGISNVGDSMNLVLKVDNTPLDTMRVNGLANGNHNTINFTTPWSSEVLGGHIVEIFVDSDDEISESQEYNNEATRTIFVGQLPDLYVDYFRTETPNPMLYSATNLEALIKNGGDTACSAAIEFYYVDANLDTILIGTTTVTVGVDDSVNISYPWTSVYSPATLVLKITNTSVIEAITDNNIAYYSISPITTTIQTEIEATCISSGQIKAIVTGGISPYSYAWSTGDSTNVLSAMAGNYTLTVTDDIGAVAHVNVAITEAVDTTYLNASSCYPADTGITVQYLTNANGCDSVVIDVVSWQADSLALMDLYNANNGTNWTYTATQYYNGTTLVAIPNAGTTWDLATPMNTWHGVQIDDKGCVEVLSLRKGNLLGNLMNLDLPSLKHLDLSDNQLTGNILDFSHLPKLEGLDLDTNNLNGTIPDFQYLPKLKYFWAGENQLEGNVPNCFNMPDLEQLSLPNNQLDSCGTLLHLLNLKLVAIEHNQLTFDDLLSIGDSVTCTYIPQDSAGVTQAVELDENDHYIIDLGFDDTVTTSIYTWYKNGEFLATTTDNQYIIDNARLTDAGRYDIVVSNCLIPSLLLNTRSIYVDIQSVLPVELLYFDGVLLDDNTVQLTWATATEINNQGFEIQRSANGVDWVVIGFITGHGTTPLLQNYAFIDATPLNGVNYYRLKQIDFDEQFEYSNIVSTIIGERKKSAIIVYPNPVPSDWNELNVFHAKGQATIYNVLGQPVKQLSIEDNNIIININDLVGGQYILSIQRDDDTIDTIRFIKSN